MHLAACEQPLVDFADEMPLGQGPMLMEQKIIGFRPIAATNGVHVTSTARNDQPGLSTFAFNQGVDGDGRAVDQFIDRRCIKTTFANAVDDAAGELRRRRQALGFDKTALFGVEPDQIREGATNINRDDDHALSAASSVSGNTSGGAIERPPRCPDVKRRRYPAL